MRIYHTSAMALALAGALILTTVDAAESEGWGTIKGQVAWDGPDVPKRKQIEEVNKNQDKTECLKNGPLLDDSLVVNPKNKGVRWCLVYLMSEKGFNKDIPIHPKLKEIKNKTVEIDQPCCKFEPHFVVMREGQTLLFKNPAAFPHNVNLQGGVKGPSINPLIPPGGKEEVKNIVARYIPMEVRCNIHGWMSARIAVLKNPYFAVTDEDGNFEIKDAPAGDFRLVVWHEKTGWVVGDGTPSKNGKKITIKNGETTDLGKIAMKPPKD
jgi:plastocyanin